jgi:hypothetical protein
LGQEWDKILAGQNYLPIAVQLRHSTMRTIARETPADVDLNGKEDTRRYRATPPIRMRSRPRQATDESSCVDHEKSGCAPGVPQIRVGLDLGSSQASLLGV